MLKKIISLFTILGLFSIAACAGGVSSRGGYYRHRYGPDPWLYRGGYARDRVHVVSEKEVRALEEIDSVRLSEPAEPMPDMGFGGADMDFGGDDIDF